MEVCDQCGGIIWEDDDDRLIYYTLGIAMFCSRECVEDAKDEIRLGGTPKWRA